MSVWLITGGAGFIGSHFVQRAVQDSSNTIVVIDKLTYASNLTALSELIDNNLIHFYQGDICDDALLKQIFSRFKITSIVHFAAESHVDRSISTPDNFIQSNILGTYRLLEVAKTHWREQNNQLFLHVSTDEVYGSLNENAPPFTELSPYQPNSPYSASKAASDHLVRAWSKTYNIPSIITHCSNNYGPNQHIEKLIPHTILNAIQNKMIPLYGSGKQIRDWIHVFDHNEALIRLIKHGARGETYNIGANCELQNIELVNLICKSVDKHLQRPSGETANLITHVKDRPGHDIRYSINNEKMCTIDEWHPQHNISNDIDDLVVWYIDHYKSLQP